MLYDAYVWMIICSADLLQTLKAIADTHKSSLLLQAGKGDSQDRSDIWKCHGITLVFGNVMALPWP